VTDPAAINTLWGALTAEALARLGVEDAVISPGSRSTPLAVALARHPRLECRAILDERSAGFFALGLALAKQQPVVLLCTSGTAVANYFPAVVEASESGVPLLLLTADRPPESRHRQAGQTIDQVKVYGGFVRWSVEAPVPSSEPEVLAAWRDLLAQAVARAIGGSGGPVHLNCPFREPLGPVEAGRLQLDEALAPLVSEIGPPRRPELVQARLPSLPPEGWIIAGPARPRDPERYVRAVGDLGEALGWPIFADALNPCRHFADLLPRPVIAAYEAVLRMPEAGRRWRPEAILQLGPLPTSKVLRRLLQRWQLPTWLAHAEGHGHNAVAAPAISLGVGPENLVAPLARPPDAGWWAALASLDARARLALEAELAEASHAEPAIAARIFEASPPETPIFVASSMPVRDAESFWGANGDRRRIFFNRGANGIDGTLSTALGMAEGLAQPSLLYTGDLALLHDTNGMLVARNSFSGSLTIVCLNNGGGGIFHHLPVARESDVFEDFFATPQSVDFRTWARAYGIAYRLANNVDELCDWLHVLPDHGVRLLEVRTDREADALYRRGLFERVVAGLA
jgi:2-succinyl-5-enolpyruvyl-6-hydroxy-3-cyclohexene-1-carboxylate synthase